MQKIGLSTYLRRFKPPIIPLKLLFTGPFVLELVLAVGAIGYISFLNGQKAVNELVEKLHIETTERVQQQLNTYLNIPHLINRINVDDIGIGEIDLENVEGLERHFWQQIQHFPSTSYIYVGTTQEIFIGAEQVSNSLPNVAFWTAEDPEGRFETYSTNTDGTRKELLSVVDGYNLVTRPWFVNGREAGQEAWGDIYVWAAPYINMALPAVKPLYDESGALQAVFAVDLSLQTISDFLQTIKISENGEVFILEENGLLVSSSNGDAVVAEVDGSLERLSAMNSTNILLRGATDRIQEEYEDLSEIAEDSRVDFQLDGERYLTWVTPNRDQFGLNWLIVVVVPEGDFMGSIDANTRATFRLSLIALAIALAVGSVTARWAVKPIEQLSKASNAISKGDWNRKISVGRVKELRVLSQSFRRMANQLIHDARYDSLTRLPNRSLFLSRLKDSLEEMQSHESYLFAVLYLDFDRFKALNDSYGHITGDYFLIKVSTILKNLISGDDIVARLGGDEFAILLEDIESIQCATDVAERIRTSLKEPLEVDKRMFFSTASIGIVLGRKNYSNELEILRDADIAMYAAKQSGKDCYMIFDEPMHNKALQDLNFENDLRRAIEREEFELYYQPIMSLCTRRLEGFEVLIRWNHPDRGLIFPTRFIPVAEETGLIIPLGELILRQAFQQLKIWQDKQNAPEDLYIHINLSGKQILDPEFLSKIDLLLEETQVSGDRVHLEITESVFMERSIEIIQILTKLRSRGFNLSIDDFGTGYSSLSYLQRLPVDILKIPRCFVSNIGSDPGRYEITRAITTLAHTLGLRVVAEGIESESDLEQLVALGCEFGQGYLLERPMNAATTESWILSYSEYPC